MKKKFVQYDPYYTPDPNEKMKEVGDLGNRLYESSVRSGKQNKRR